MWLRDAKAFVSYSQCKSHFGKIYIGQEKIQTLANEDMADFK